ncbi:MAG: hypothetical protein ABJL72_21820 [Roseobacter sp.]
MTAERKFKFFTLLALGILCSGPANSHASEQGFVLLLPTGVYTAAGTMTVIASIVLVTCLPSSLLSKLFSHIAWGGQKRGEIDRASTAVSFAATSVLIFLVFVGFYGPTDPQNNLLPLVIWTVWWGGVFVVQGTLFDIWKWINPWEGFVSVFGLGRNPVFRMPDRLRAWPSVGIIILFQFFLLADVAPSDPPRLGTFVLIYWFVTLIGVELFGKDTWLERAECFTVMFRLIGAFRPFQYGEQLRFGFPGWAALKDGPLDMSRAAFCLIILTGGSFDGVHETFWWLVKIGINPLEFPGRSAVVWSSIMGLLAATVLLFLLFGFAIWLGLKAVQLHGQSDSIPFLTAFNLFAVTLLPIALGYHFAHYLVAFLVQIKVTLSTLSDPMALGWNLFGLGAVKATFGFLSVPETVKIIWLTQAGVVVFSHVVSVLMGHHVARALYDNAKDVVFVQLGLTLLMIAYTVFGLWLLASPRGA